LIRLADRDDDIILGVVERVATDVRDIQSEFRLRVHPVRRGRLLSPRPGAETGPVAAVPATQAAIEAASAHAAREIRPAAPGDGHKCGAAR